MSKEDVKRVKRRLEKAKQEIAWMLSVMRDPDEALKSYNLSEAEKESIVQESLEVMTELLLPLAQQLAQHPLAPIQSVTLGQMENLHFARYDFNNVLSSGDVVSVEVVGRGEQLRRVSSRGYDVIGDITSSSISGTIHTGTGDINIGRRPPINDQSDVVSSGGGPRQGEDPEEEIG